MTENSKELRNHVAFPIKRYLGGAIIQGLLTYVMAVGMAGGRSIGFWGAFTQVFLLACAVSFLPYFITYCRNLKKSEWVFWWCFFGTFIPFGLVILIIATLYTLLAERKGAFIKGMCKKSSKASAVKMKATAEKVKHLPKKAYKWAIAVIIVILCLVGYQKASYDKEKEELAMIYFEDCEKSHHDFMEKFGFAMTPEQRKREADGWKKDCYCEYEAIFESFDNPFNAMKHARHIVKHLDGWRSYYDVKEPDFKAKWKVNTRHCKQGSM